MERAINSKLGNLISLLGSDVNQLDNLKKSKEKKACLTSRNLTFPFLKIIYLFNFCAGSSLLWGLFSSCSGQASHCGSFPCWGTWALELGLSSCGAQACCSVACGIFLDQGLNLSLLHLPGRCFTTEPPGKPFTFLNFSNSSGWYLLSPVYHMQFI